jgi:hypothetical protein
MASARANIASRSQEAPRRPQRGPEVIVLTRLRRPPEIELGLAVVREAERQAGDIDRQLSLDLRLALTA